MPHNEEDNLLNSQPEESTSLQAHIEMFLYKDEEGRLKTKFTLKGNNPFEILGLLESLSEQIKNEIKLMLRET